MTLKILLKNIGEMAIKQKLVNYSAAGASLGEINGLELKWYPLVFSIPSGTHEIEEDTTKFDLTIYYVDRLLEDNANTIDIFSSSVENLKNIIRGIKKLPGVVDVDSIYSIRNFMPEKNNDRLAGAYAQVKITVVNDTICFEDE